MAGLKTISITANMGDSSAIYADIRDHKMVIDQPTAAGGKNEGPTPLEYFLFSLAGLPPTGGFMGKYVIFLAAIRSGRYLLAVAGVVDDGGLHIPGVLDLDRDGDIDVVQTAATMLSWFPSDINRSTADVGFLNRVAIDDNVNGVRSASVIDLDSDGEMDRIVLG